MEAAQGGAPQRVALDTDIGSDVDDLLALAVLLGSPELALAAVTTVYGDVLLRARIVRRALRMAGGPDVPVAPGRSTTRSGREVWWAGHEGRLMPDLDAEPVDPTLDAIGLLAASPLVAAIGPLTNLADAVELPGSAIEHAVLMGGDFAGAGPEHNLACDVDAAVTVVESGVGLTVIGLDQTTRVRLDRAAAHAFEQAGGLGRVLAAEMRQFEEYLGRDHTVPHDPLAILTMARPDLFRFETGTVRVDATGPDAGRTRFEPDSAGTHSAGKHSAGQHRVVTDVDVESAAAEIVRRALVGLGS
jgi:purine nucleosidase